MEFFLKRVPAFSRALGDFDSDNDDDNDNNDDMLDEELNASDASLLLTNEQDEELSADQVFRNYSSTSHVIITIGPLMSAFIILSLNLIHKSLFVVKASYKKTYLLFTSYLIPDCDTLIICIEYEPRNISFEQKHIFCQYLTNTFHQNNLNADNKHHVKDINILCSRSVNHFLSKSKVSTPFIRCISTYTTLKDCQFPILEQPNILTGLPAEALTWFYFNSLPANLYTVFYLPHVGVCEWSAVKEIFNFLLSVNIGIIPKRLSHKNEWDKNLLKEELVDICITTVCNSERAKTDQMYT
ncbi:unnamed protein product [Heterobilharzia americana]|nr:unnamed protein product [Heterobilharzia americana]CAH8570397.1 unnamed protein product [Heterobilharzia americana]